MSGEMPYVRRSLGAGLADQSLALASSALSVQSNITRGNALVQERAIFGYTLPQLPDFLSDPNLLVAPEPERMSRLFQRWAALVANLWKWQHCAFALRMAVRPERGAVDLAIIARASALRSQLDTLISAIAGDLVQLFAGLHIPLKPIIQPESLDQWLAPFEQPALIELRQAEEVLPLQVGNNEAYVVYPYWGASGSWLDIFETLVRLPLPVVVTLHIEPTELSSEERATMAEAASYAKQLAEHQFDGLYFRNIRIPDANAALVGRIYESNLRRLARPLLLGVQVVSADRVAALTVAQALSVAITATPDQPIMPEEQEISAQAQLVVPRSTQELAAAQRTLQLLEAVTHFGAASVVG